MIRKIFEGNLPYELLLTIRQIRNLRNAFGINLAVNTKLSKAQISKLIQSGGFLKALFSKLATPIMKVTTL